MPPAQTSLLRSGPLDPSAFLMSPLGCLRAISDLIFSDWTLDLYNHIYSSSLLVLMSGTFIQSQVQGHCWYLHLYMPLGNPLWNPDSLTAWIPLDPYSYLHNPSPAPPPRPSHHHLLLRWHSSLLTHLSLAIPRLTALRFITLYR